MPLPPAFWVYLNCWSPAPGPIVSRQAIIDGVWSDAFVTDTSLAEAISVLRQALGDDPQSPQYIQTVHRRGYRLSLLSPRFPPLQSTRPRPVLPR